MVAACAGPRLNCGGRLLDLSVPRVMGILNVTPDSFSDGGEFFAIARALEHARVMVEEGAAIIDVGGESTRPGAAAVSAEEERARVVPVIQALAAELPVPISIDTSKPEIMVAAVKAGAGLINDIDALRQPGALVVAAELGVPVCLMHMQGRPRTMQHDPRYQDVVSEVGEFLLARADAAMAAGVRRENILLDPGFGFGKTLEHNLALLRELETLTGSGFPLLAGISRKSMLGAITGRPASERLAASLAAAVMAVERGACIIRAHDVGPTVDALSVTHAVCA